MPTLSVALEEGFSGQEVWLQVDGREVYRRAVTTRTQIGLADRVELELPAGAHQLLVAIEGVEQRTVEVALAGPLYVGISLAAEGGVRHRMSSVPFGYL